MRYIDADALIKKIYPMGIGDGKYTINAQAVKFAIDNAPTADVVPKIEVEIWKETTEKCEEAYEAWHRTAELNAQRIIELETEKDALIKNYSECMKDYARGIFEEIEKIMLDGAIGGKYPAKVINPDKYAELKKKHTERDT